MTKGKKGSIKTNLLISLIVFSLLSMTIIGSISYLFINRTGNITTEESTDALEEQIQRNIQTTAIENGNIIKEKLSSAESMVNLMAKELDNVFADDSRFGYRKTYYDYFFEYNRSLGLFPSDTYYDTNYEVWLSWSYASYYFSHSTPDNYQNWLNEDSELNSTLSTVANMDYIFQMIHNNAPEFRWLYITVPVSNTTLFINYPGSIVGGTIQERINDPYIPVNEDWYQSVLSGEGDIIFTEPYYDEIDGVPLITIGRRVNLDDGNYAVICGDISITDIVNKILNVQILKTGYASLITSDGLVIAHKDSIPEPGSLEFDTIDDAEQNSDGSSALTNQQIDAITSGESGLLKYTKDEKEYYMAYLPVGKGDYISLVIVPLAEAIESVEPLEERILSARRSTTWNVIIIIAATGLASVLLGLIFGNYLVKPIERLRELVLRLSTQAMSTSPLEKLDINVDRDLIEREDETGELARGVQNLIDWYKTEYKD